MIGAIRLRTLFLLVSFCLQLATALILPGTGLVSTNNAVDLQVVIFEHTPLGTGGLVLNQPTPICLRDLDIPRFQKFENHTIMLGCGSSNEEGNFNVPLGDMAPWFWIHSSTNIGKSFPLENAEGPLFMGGNLEEATLLIEQEELDPLSFKFFYKYMKWEGDELQREIDEHKWKVSKQDPSKALRPYSLPVFD